MPQNALTGMLDGLKTASLASEQQRQLTHPQLSDPLLHMLKANFDFSSIDVAKQRHARKYFVLNPTGQTETKHSWKTFFIEEMDYAYSTFDNSKLLDLVV
jgi:hypothetical protein